MDIPGTPEAYPEGNNGIIAIVGRANVGKSTLLNHLLQEKVSIVTPIAQTTRNRIRGILTESRGQLVFLDTPGLHKASNDLGKIMNQSALSSIKGADLVLLVTDASKEPRREDLEWIKTLTSVSTPVFLALNKADKSDRFAPLYIEAWKEAAGSDLPEDKAFTISAQEGTGTEDLLASLFQHMPEGPRLFPEEMLTDFPRKMAISDIIREKVIRDLRDELPHSIGVQVMNLREEEDGWDINVRIYVKKHSHKGIVIGFKGRKLRAIRRASEKEVSETFDTKATIHLNVRVEKHWQENHFLLQQMGYRE